MRKPLIDGLIIRSRAKWYEAAEKSSKYFRNLEKRNYKSKIIPALKNEDGIDITDQTVILKELERHITDVFSNHDMAEDLNDFIGNLGLPKVTEREAAELGKQISLDEINNVLKKMKHKSPGSDGFPPEFFKYF